ncbi:MAG TPA: DUF1206 domain-containing protein [Bryobacteraceae bacterium]|nr:DUF1206 domain-containing protein [Bryobacteraceae bacterium]
MAHVDLGSSQAKQGIDNVRHSEWLEWLTRIGFACKGVVYFLIGALALISALGNGGETTDVRGVLGRIATQTLGEFALAVIAAGLFAYALWRFCSAIYDTEDEGSDKKGLAKRAGYAISGAIYSGFAIVALKIVMGEGGGASSGSSNAQTWSAELMQAPGGTLLLMAIGAGVIVAGSMQIRHGLKEDFMKKMRTRRMSHTERDWCSKAGKAGYTARGIVFGLTGVFFIYAGVQHNAQQVRGMEGALDTIARQPFGPWLLGLVAVGLAAYGVYSLFAARYRTVHN